MHNNLSRLMGISVLKTVFRNIENSLKIYAFCSLSISGNNILQYFRIFSKTEFCNMFVGYLWRREDNPMCGEEGVYDPISETEWPEEIIKIYRL